MSFSARLKLPASIIFSADLTAGSSLVNALLAPVSVRSAARTDEVMSRNPARVMNRRMMVLEPKEGQFAEAYSFSTRQATACCRRFNVSDDSVRAMRAAPGATARVRARHRMWREG